jgi:hypothetical protein
MRPQPLHDTLSSAETLSRNDPDLDVMVTMHFDRRVRWDRVHRQARRIAAGRAARQRIEQECRAAEEAARAAIRRISQTPWIVVALVAAGVMCGLWATL